MVIVVCLYRDEIEIQRLRNLWRMIIRDYLHLIIAHLNISETSLRIMILAVLNRH